MMRHGCWAPRLAVLFLGLSLPALLLTGPSAQAEILRFREVEPGLLRGSQPENAHDYEWLLNDHGVRTVVNLRKDDTVDSEREYLEARGVRFISVPMSGFFAPPKEDVAQVLDAMADPALRPLFLHCHHGKDRTGMAVGFYRMRYQGWTHRQAYREMRSLGFNPALLGLTGFFWLHSAEDF